MPIKNLDNLRNTQKNAIIDLNKGDLCSDHLSVPSYPFKYERDISLKNGTILHVRPIRGEDELALRQFFKELSEESVFFRFGHRRVNLSHDCLAKICQVDYERDLSFLAVVCGDEQIIIGEARLNRFADLKIAELSFVIADQWQGQGVGNLLMDFCMLIARKIGLKTLLMLVMKSNERMRQFGYKYGFQPLPCNKEDDMEEMQLNLNQKRGSLYSFQHHSDVKPQREEMFNGYCR